MSQSVKNHESLVHHAEWWLENEITWLIVQHMFIRQTRMAYATSNVQYTRIRTYLVHSMRCEEYV